MFGLKKGESIKLYLLVHFFRHNFSALGETGFRRTDAFTSKQSVKWDALCALQSGTMSQGLCSSSQALTRPPTTALVVH
jgi:hypothetical protein